MSDSADRQPPREAGRQRKCERESGVGVPSPLDLLPTALLDPPQNGGVPTTVRGKRRRSRTHTAQCLGVQVQIRTADYDDGRRARHAGDPFCESKPDDWKVGWLDERDRPSTPLEEAA